ncbi:MAG: RsmB/NOP family class I SAM-dependent RNA methyltransferase [Hyphomicrobiales bacterium]|nr:RsmB/NOP family class I SAM-dependent RNA methyltransferase [Hyphomicrobiales bacterium]
MIPAARLSAAIEILADIGAARRPAADALRDWGRARRYAGSKDRAAIAAIVYDGLRRRASASWIMGADTPRAMALGALRLARGQSVDAIAALCTGEGHAPAPLTSEERARLESADLSGAPAHVAGDYPEWLAPHFARAFGDEAAAEGRALAARAPIDLRVNRLKGTRDKARAALAHLNPQNTPISPDGLRILVGEDGRAPALTAEPAFLKGLVELQDESSQLAALLAGAKPGEQALDLCAGGGGKTLALAAVMDNRGQLYATDADARRLAPIHERLTRAGVRNAQVRAPRGAQDVLADLEERCDLVLIDAPCTGVGAWRRNPDAKWRVRPGALEQRMADQDRVLARGARFVKSGGRLVYVTCSLLREENEDRVAAFLAAHDDFSALAMDDVAQQAGLSGITPASGRPGVTLRTSQTGGDGFYVCVMKRR